MISKLVVLECIKVVIPFVISNGFLIISPICLKNKSGLFVLLSAECELYQLLKTKILILNQYNEIQ